MALGRCVRLSIGIGVALLVSVFTFSSGASAAAALTITPISWGVVGLDSNDVSTGPSTFFVGARICNIGSDPATNTSASFVWDTVDAYISLGDAATRAVGTIAAGACADVYFTAVVSRDANAYDHAREFHVEASADGVGAVSTPVGRELYVEHLVSQNRNGVLSFSGPTAVQLGDTVTYTVTTKTATQGYEQLVGSSTFPTSIFRIVSTATTYSAPSGATNDTLYADACGWDADPASGSYRSCIGPEAYTGGKAGGDPIVTTYTLEVVGTGSAVVQTLIYDFSGSSYHYNSDFGTSVTVTSTVPADADLGVGVGDGPDPVGSGGALAYTVSVSNAGPDGASGVVLTANLPVGVGFVSASGTGWSCGHVSGVVTCSRASLASGVSAPDVTIDVTAPGSAGTVTLTASVDAATADSNAANDSDSEDTTVSGANVPPVAGDDSASTSAGTPVTIPVLGNDSDGDSDPLTIVAFTSPGSGTVSCATTCTYMPAGGFTGTDAFTYTVGDGRGGTDTAAVTITVTAGSGGGSTPANAPPVAVDDLVATSAGTPATIPVVSNDSDPDADSLSIVSFTQPTSGSVTCTATTCTYSPATGTRGVVTFTYVVGDGRGGTDTAIVTVDVAAAPEGEGSRASGGPEPTAAPKRTPMPKPMQKQKPKPASKRRAPRPQLRTTKKALTERASAGGVVEYAIMVANTGRGPARHLRICDVLSDELTFASAPGARFVRGQACWSVPVLRPGARVTFTVKAKVDTTARGEVANVLILSGDGIRTRVRARVVVGVRGVRVGSRAGGVTG